MKIRNTIGVLISLSLLNISCLDDLKPEKETNYPPVPEGECYFSINVKAGDVVDLTRAVDPDASKEDLAIHSVRVVLYDGEESQASKCKVEYVFEFNMKTADTWSDPSNPTNWIADPGNHIADSQPGYLIPSGEHLSPTTNFNDYEFITFAQRVKDKPYKMLVILNGRNSDGTLNSEIYKATNKGSYLYQFKQAISSSINTTDGTIAGGKGILMTNHQGLVTVNKNQLAKTVEQAHAAPVRVSVDRLVAKVTLRHADNIKLPEGIDPNSVTWALDITNKKTYWMREAIPGEQTDPTMQTLYARDPNFTVLTSAIEKSAEFNTFFNEYYLSPNQINNQLGQYIYTLENTIDIENKQFTDYEDRITRIIVGYKYTPEGFSKNDNYYIYHNKIINQQEINNYLQNPTYEIPGLEDLRTVLSELQQKNYPLNGSSANYYEHNGFRYCPQGQLYYIIPIQHFGVSQASPGYYGVVRNNIYDITINSLSAPDIAGPYLSANINIQPWALRGQTNTIGISLIERTYAPLKVYYWSIKENINLYQKKWAEETGNPISQAPKTVP
ncbi:MAG: Mfa1 family fimbria major subunit [Bacteroides sp.]|nr:Mfa1 family fimbria major subunit [Bacteroides sp.]